MKSFNELTNQKVSRLFFVVWPPMGEAKAIDIDISFGFVFHQNPDRLHIITTNKKDMWSPCLLVKNLPVYVYSWSVFAPRMKAWMKAENTDDLKTEYYDVTKAKPFSSIVSSRIRSIELIGLKKNPEPFGIKIDFDEDYILSTPISDGNTVETAQFNKHDNLLNFMSMGVLEYRKLPKQR